jgi:hypothetical protein
MRDVYTELNKNILIGGRHSAVKYLRFNSVYNQSLFTSKIATEVFSENLVLRCMASKPRSETLPVLLFSLRLNLFEATTSVSCCHFLFLATLFYNRPLRCILCRLF